MHRLSTLAGSLVALSSLASPAGELELVSAPRAGTARTTSFDTNLELEGGELSCIMNDEDVPSMYLPLLHLEMIDARSVEVTESHESEHSLRRYDHLGWENDGSMSMIQSDVEESFPWSVDAGSPLESRLVRLAPGGADPAFADDGPNDNELLEALVPDLSLAALLPGESVEVGASWNADGAALAVLFDPSGDVSWDLPEEATAHMLPEVLEQSVAGDLGIVLREVSDDGSRAQCSVEGTLTRTTLQPGDLSRVPVVDGTATDTVTETWEAEGTLVWDLGANCVAALELDGYFSQETVTRRDPDQPGSTYEGTFFVSGTYSIAVEGLEAEEDPQ